MSQTLPRWIALALAALALLGLAWQFQVNGTKPGLSGVGIRLWLMAKHFTHWANALCALTLLRAALGRRDPDLAAAAVIATTMTGLVWAAFIAGPVPLPVPHWYPDLILHRLVPWSMAPWWLACAPRPQRFRPLAWLSPALVYLPHALARGALTGRWPYDFLNPARGAVPMVLTLTGLLVAFLGLAALLWRLRSVQPLFLQE